jgi:membrane dipeptidase
MPTNQITRRELFQATASAACGAGLATATVRARAAERPKFNAVTDTAWEAGLATLKPSPLELERGLKLHAESLVFDCYGFSPRCAVDGDRIAKAVAAGASTSEVQDMQEDMGMTRCVVSPEERSEFELGWQAAGVTCIFQNAGEEGQDPLRLLKRLGRFTYLTDHLRNFLFKAVDPDDIEAAHQSGRHCLYFTGKSKKAKEQKGTF